MKFASKLVRVAGGVTTRKGVPSVFFRGSVDSLTRDDLVAVANDLARAAHGGLDAAVVGTVLPDFELRHVKVLYAASGGSAELGVANGVGLNGQLYLFGARAADVDALVDALEAAQLAVSTTDEVVQWGARVAAAAASAELLRVESARLSGGLSVFQQGGRLEMQVAVRLLDQPQRLQLQIKTADLSNGIGWIKYLRLSDLERIAAARALGRRQEGEKQLQRILARFEKTASNSDFAAINGRASFARMLTVLQNQTSAGN